MGKHKPADTALDPGKIMEQILLEDISGHMNGKEFDVLADLITFYDKTEICGWWGN